MADNINDYVPFMDKYPELKLRPTSEFPGHGCIQKYDYVQNLNLRDQDIPGGCFYLIVQDGLFGLLMFDRGIFWDSETIAMYPVYENIEIYYLSGRSFRAIVKKDGKYGFVLWSYNEFCFNDVYETPIVYDSITKINDKRFKAIADGNVVYFDMTGKVLR